LMRRAMAGIVPDEILNRKRKAFVVRAPIKAIASNLPATLALTEDMQCELFGIVDAKALADTLRTTRHGDEVAITSLLRTLATEVWLRSLPASILRRPRLLIPSAPTAQEPDQKADVLHPRLLFQLRQNPLERR